MYQQSASSGRADHAQVAAEVDERAVRAGRGELLGNDVGGEALADAAGIDADAVGQPHQPRLRRHRDLVEPPRAHAGPQGVVWVPYRGPKRRPWCRDVVEVAVVAEGVMVAEDRRVVGTVR